MGSVIEPTQYAENERLFGQCEECFFVWDRGDEPWHDSDCPARIDGQDAPVSDAGTMEP